MWFTVNSQLATETGDTAITGYRFDRLICIMAEKERTTFLQAMFKEKSQKLSHNNNYLCL